MKKIICFISCLIILLIIITGKVSVKGHSTLLDVVYDECQSRDYVNSSDIGDGIDEC